MMERGNIAIVLAVVLSSGEAFAQGDNPVLVFCDDGQLGAGEGGCSSLVKAVQNELQDFYLDVVHVARSVEWTEGAVHAPAGIVAETRQMAAIFSVWFSRSGFSPGTMLTLNVYDPAIDQTISRTLSAFDATGSLNQSDVAFHTRIIMGASLYSDIDAIQDDENLVALAIPEERVAFFEEKASGRRSWVALRLGYLFTGYPTERHWYHGLGFDVSLIPVERLELFLDLGISFLQEDLRGDTGTASWDLTNRKFLVGVGARYDVLGHKRIGILPQAGFHVGVTSVDVGYEGGGGRYTGAHPSVWTGLEVRVHLARRVSLGADLRFEYLFRHEAVYLHEEVEGNDRKTLIFEASPFRFGALMMICVSI